LANGRHLVRVGVSIPGVHLFAPPNGLELSGPAKARSHYRAAVTGSAPLACGLGRQRVVRLMPVDRQARKRDWFGYCHGDRSAYSQ